LIQFWSVQLGNYSKCVNIALKQGKISKKIADKIKASTDPDEAIDSIVADLVGKKRDAVGDTIKLNAAWEHIKAYPLDENGNPQYHQALNAMLVKDPSGQGHYYNIDKRAQYHEAVYHSKISDFLSTFRTRNLGFSQDEEGLRMLVIALHGGKVKRPDIQKFAQQLSGLFHTIRRDFNKAGGMIHKLDDWTLPQRHDRAAILAKGKDEAESKKLWKEHITPLLDRKKMTNNKGKVLNDEELDKSLDYVFDSIITGGLNKLKDFEAPKLNGKLSRSKSHERFLHFKDGESWLTYQDHYGRGDVFTLITDHIHTYSNDIAQMELLGTNPTVTFEQLVNQIRKETGQAPVSDSFSRAVFNNVSGKTNGGELTSLADFGQSARNVTSAGLLGNAFISSVADVGYIAITANYNNIGVVKVFNRQFSLMDPSNEADRILAVKLGLIADAWTGRAASNSRYADIYGTGWTAKAAEGVMRGSVLTSWTDSGRKAFGMEFSAMLAENFHKGIDELHPDVQRAFEMYGIKKQHWDTFRKQTPIIHKGVVFADMTKSGGGKFHQMVLSETDFAVPTPDARVKAIMNGGLERGSVSGQGMRFGTMYKSFLTTIATTHFYRAAYQASLGQKLAYAGTILASTTIMGGVAVQLKDIAKGREPRKVDEKFLVAAFLQGGGASLLGDFVFSDHNRYGDSIGKTLAGPALGLVDDVSGLVFGNIQSAIQGEDTSVTGDLSKMGKKLAPDTWYLQLVTHEMINQLAALADPEQKQKELRVIAKREKDYGQGNWWQTIKSGDR
tara:strand:+ start:1603 stop:3954 length:2352 start_codon:yes stop_codon:yes gene_type:complete